MLMSNTHRQKCESCEKFVKFGCKKSPCCGAKTYFDWDEAYECGYPSICGVVSGDRF